MNSARQGPSVVPNSPIPRAQPFEHLMRQARAQPFGLLFDTSEQRMSYADGLRAATQIAGQIRELGVRPGDLVALDLPLALELLFIEALFHEAAVSCMSTAVLGERPALMVDWLFSSSQTESPAARRTVHVDGPFLRHVSARPAIAAPVGFASPASVCRMAFSSGTTGTPKPIAFTLEMLDDRMAAVADLFVDGPSMSLLDMATPSGFHTFCASVAVGQPFLLAGDPGGRVELINRHGVTSIKASPAQIAALTAELERTHGDVPSLRVIFSAGTLLPPAVAQAARRATGAQIHNLYGSTEAGRAAARGTDSDDPLDAGTVTPGTVVQIVDADDREVPPGEVGTIRIRTRFPADGYYGDPEATGRFFRDGWFYPGDLGRLSSDGHLTLAGRLSEFVNAGGMKVDPAPLEAFAVGARGVIDAAGFATTSEVGLTELVLAVVTTDGFDASHLIGELRRVFGGSTPSAVFLVPEIPRNAMGKPQREALAALYSKATGP